MQFSRLLAQSIIWRGIYFVTLFFVNLLLSRYLQASASGIIFYVSNTFTFIQLIAGLSLENGITFFVAGKHISANKLLWLCLLWISFLIFAQIIIFHFFTFPDTASGLKHLPEYAFCFITGMLLTSYSSNLFYTKGNFFMPNIILGTINLFFIIFLLIYRGLVNELNKEFIVDVYFFMLFLQGLAITIACILKNKSWLEIALPDLLNIKIFIKYSSKVLLFNVLLFLVYRVDYYFVRFSPVCTAADLGNYIQASKLGQMLLVVPQIIGSAVYPQVSSGIDTKSVSAIIILMAKVFAFLFLLLFIIILTCGKWFFPFLFGDTFQHIQVPLLLLLPGIYSLSIMSGLSNFFSGKGNVGISVRAALSALIVVLTGDFLFVRNYGIVAAAIVSSIGYTLMCSWYLRRFAKENKVSYKDMFSWSIKDRLLLKSFYSKKTNKFSNADNRL